MYSKNYLFRFYSSNSYSRVRCILLQVRIRYSNQYTLLISLIVTVEHELIVSQHVRWISDKRQAKKILRQGYSYCFTFLRNLDGAVLEFFFPLVKPKHSTAEFEERRHVKALLINWSHVKKKKKNANELSSPQVSPQVVRPICKFRYVLINYHSS